MATQFVPFQRKVTQRFFVEAGFVQTRPAKTKAAFQVMMPIAPPELFRTSIVISRVCVESGGVVGAATTGQITYTSGSGGSWTDSLTAASSGYTNATASFSK